MDTQILLYLWRDFEVDINKFNMYALKMQTACQSEGSGEPDDPSSHHQEPVRPPAQDCSSFDIVRATQVFI